MKYRSLLPLLLCAFAHAGPAYDRDDWGRWRDADGDCQDTRQEVLIRDATAVTLNASGCRVTSGNWIGHFSGNAYTDPSDLDVDHVVPLKHAHDTGGSAWSTADKRTFANDMENLLAVDDGLNQSKGSKGITEWLPFRDSCGYIQRFMSVKVRYGLGTSFGEMALWGQCGTAPAPPTVKMSRSGICHDQSSRHYNRTVNYTPYPTVSACLAAGGRLPRG